MLKGRMVHGPAQKQYILAALRFPRIEPMRCFTDSANRVGPLIATARLPPTGSGCGCYWHSPRGVVADPPPAARTSLLRWTATDDAEHRPYLLLTRGTEWSSDLP